MSDNDKKGQARRARSRRVPRPFASPEAKNVAEKTAAVLGLSVNEVLEYGQPSGKKGLWRVADVNKASFAARQHLDKLAPAGLEPAVPEEAEAGAVPRPSLGQRFTAATTSADDRLAAWEKRLRDWRPPKFQRPSWLRMPARRPQFQRPKVGEAVERLDAWLNQPDLSFPRRAAMAIATGVVIGLVLLLVGVLTYAAVLLVGQVIVPAPTQVVAAVSTATPIAPVAMPTFTPVPPTPEPTATPVVAAEVVTPTAAIAPVEEAVPSPTAPPPAQPATTVVKGHIENGAGLEVVLFAGSDIVASTTTSASGNYAFTNVTGGNYAVVVGEATPMAITVAAGAESVTVTEFHKVVKGDNLWNIYGPHSWSDFMEFADAHGLKHYEAGGKLIVIIQPGMILDLAGMSP